MTARSYLNKYTPEEIAVAEAALASLERAGPVPIKRVDVNAESYLNGDYQAVGSKRASDWGV